MIAGILLSFTGCSNQNVAFNVKGKPVSGYVRMTQVRAPTSAVVMPANASSIHLNDRAANAEPDTQAGRMRYR